VEVINRDILMTYTHLIILQMNGS